MAAWIGSTAGRYSSSAGGWASMTSSAPATNPRQNPSSQCGTLTVFVRSLSLAKSHSEWSPSKSP